MRSKISAVSDCVSQAKEPGFRVVSDFVKAVCVLLFHVLGTRYHATGREDRGRENPGQTDLVSAPRNIPALSKEAQEEAGARQTVYQGGRDA